MSRCLRYQNPTIYEHLASQYVAGMLTPRVRSRIETLAKTVPELDRALAQWSDSFSELHLHVETPKLKTDNLSNIWENIEQQTQDSSTKHRSTKHSENSANKEQQNTGFFSRLFVWQLATMSGALASLVLAVMLWTSGAPQIQQTQQTSQQVLQNAAIAGPDYLANMALHNSSDQEVQFVISAYFKNSQDPSRLYVQWPKNQTPKNNDLVPSHKDLHLWAEDKDSGELVYIGVQPEGKDQWDLTKPAWAAITNSSRLLMTKAKSVDEQNIVFSGKCLQLSNWEA